MYRFVLLSIGFNLNMIYLYLTFVPRRQSVFVTLCWGGFRKKPSVSCCVLV